MSKAKKGRSVLILRDENGDAIKDADSLHVGDTVWSTVNDNGCFYRVNHIHPDRHVDLHCYRMNSLHIAPHRAVYENVWPINLLTGKPLLTLDYWKSAIYKNLSANKIEWEVYKL